MSLKSRDIAWKTDVTGWIVAAIPLSAQKEWSKHAQEEPIHKKFLSGLDSCSDGAGRIVRCSYAVEDQWDTPANDGHGYGSSPSCARNSSRN